MVELIVTAINVFILFFLIGYLVSDMLSGMLTKRQERIADDINTARMSKEEALALKNDYEHRLADFESERADILENTRRKAAQMEERILLDGQQEADRVIARAKREAELKKTKLMEDVRHDMIMAASIFIISFDEFDLVTNFTAVVTTLNNVGPGLSLIGPTGNFGIFSPLSKLVLSFDMLAGRLELFPILILFLRETWKKF